MLVLPTAALIGWAAGNLAPPSVLLAAPFAVAMTIGGYVLGFLLQFLALGRVTAVAAGIVYCTEPVVAAISSALILEETLSPLQVAGGDPCQYFPAAIVANVLLEQRRLRGCTPGADCRIEPTAAMTPPAPIPLTILTGFLGAGKIDPAEPAS